MDIVSNTIPAQNMATAIADSVNTLSQDVSIDLDTQTTVQGNTNAKNAIQSAQNTISQISQVIHTASKNIQSVAEEFEAVDKKIATLPKALIR